MPQLPRESLPPHVVWLSALIPLISYHLSPVQLLLLLVSKMYSLPLRWHASMLLVLQGVSLRLFHMLGICRIWSNRRLFWGLCGVFWWVRFRESAISPQSGGHVAADRAILASLSLTLYVLFYAD